MAKTSLCTKYNKIVTKISGLVDQGYPLHSDAIVMLSEKLDKIVLQLQTEREDNASQAADCSHSLK
jgi:hypothetical protein